MRAARTTPNPTRRPPVPNILAAIGETQLVEMQRYLERRDIRVWAKLESLNPGGSAKARPAARMIAEALAGGLIGPGSTVIESTSGNMGVGLAQACRFHGLRLICVVDPRTTDVNLRTMRAMGADVRVVTEPDPEGGDLLGARLRLVAELVESVPGAFWPDQYSNGSNAESHALGTMREIHEALDGEIDHLFAAVSTAGTLAGCMDYLERMERPAKVVAVDAVGSALFGGTARPRKLPGFGAGVETPVSRTVRPDRVIRVSDIDSVVACRRLLDREAIFAGASAGAVAAALSALAPELEPGSRVAAIFHDGGAGYLDTVYDDDWIRAELGYEPADVDAMIGNRPPVEITSAAV
jgi:N-(2-amino-2-carboxyethyl)-L-glutamate synthase